MSTTDEEFETMLSQAIWCAANEGEFPPDVTVSTFEEAGVLTMNQGLVVRLPDGHEFQVTIVRSA